MLLAALSAISLAAAAAAQNQTVLVGGNSSDGGFFQFIPNNINATNGSVITFTFENPGNHSITQSSFANPCNLTSGGFASGFVQVSAGVAESPQWNLTITNDSHPIWFYCQQLAPSPHCNMGMVGAINAAGAGNFTFQAYQKIAEAHTGPSDESNGNFVGVGGSASALPGPVQSGVTLFGSPTPGAANASATGATGSAAAGTGASSSSTESGSTSSPTSGASQIAASSMLVLFAAALGFTMV